MELNIMGVLLLVLLVIYFYKYSRVLASPHWDFSSLSNGLECVYYAFCSVALARLFFVLVDIVITVPTAAELAVRGTSASGNVVITVTLLYVIWLIASLDEI